MSVIDDYYFVAHRARWYAENGVTFCGECKAVVPRGYGATPLFSDFPETLPCGHPWSVLMWRRKEKP